MPSRRRDFRLQGFVWLNRFFVETQLPFGAIHAVASFDRLGATIMLLVIFMSGIARGLVLRAVDDLTVIRPARSFCGPHFAKIYVELCNDINMPLAEQCPLLEKAFMDSTVGTVLGVRFDTVNQSWSLQPTKQQRLLHLCGSMLSSTGVSLKHMQDLMGSLNDVGQMCPFFKAFRQPLYAFLGSFNGDEDIVKPLPAQAESDLRVWCNFIRSAHLPLPIPGPELPPALSAVVFTSDAAGAPSVKVKGVLQPNCASHDRGVASVALRANGSAWYCCRLVWPRHFIAKARDEKGVFYGFKSTTLEAIGLLLPFITMPEFMSGRAVVLQVDNVAVVRGWHTKSIAKDSSASAIMSHRLACTVHVEHVSRRSTPGSELADRLSRRSTTAAKHRRLIRDAAQPRVSGGLLDWLAAPSPDFSLWRSLCDPPAPT